MQAFSSCSEQGLLFTAVHELLMVVDSLVVECMPALVVVVHWLSCSMARGIFPDLGLNPCPLHQQADS